MTSSGHAPVDQRGLGKALPARGQRAGLICQGCSGARLPSHLRTNRCCFSPPRVHHATSPQIMQDGEAHEFVYRLQQGSVPQPAAIHSSSGCAGPAAAHHWPWIAHRQVRVEKGDPRFSASRTAVAHPAATPLLHTRLSTHTSPLPLPTSHGPPLTSPSPLPLPPSTMLLPSPPGQHPLSGRHLRRDELP